MYVERRSIPVNELAVQFRNHQAFSEIFNHGLKSLFAFAQSLAGSVAFLNLLFELYVGLAQLTNHGVEGCGQRSQLVVTSDLCCVRIVSGTDC